MNAAAAVNGALSGRADFEAIARWIQPDWTVLDLGCGDGSLLTYLHKILGVRGYGVDISDDNVLACVQAGINVIQGDLERGLAAFGADAFDCVILSSTLQSIRHVEGVIGEMLRVGREGIVTFPNFGHWEARLQALAGRMPVSEALPYQWYDTPNIHLATVHDFESFCAGHGIRITGRVALHNGRPVSLLPNLMGSFAVFRFERA